MRAQRIRVKPRSSPAHLQAVVSGWLGQDGPSTYLWLGVRNEDGREVCTGILDGAALYRLAKAIVKRYESSSG